MAIKKRTSRDQDDMTGDPAFDRWVSRQLHKAYDEVLAEEVPRELLEVLERWTTDEPAREPPPTPPDKRRPRRR